MIVVRKNIFFLLQLCFCQNLSVYFLPQYLQHTCWLTVINAVTRQLLPVCFSIETKISISVRLLANLGFSDTCSHSLTCSCWKILCLFQKRRLCCRCRHNGHRLVCIAQCRCNLFDRTVWISYLADSPDIFDP